MSVRTHLKVKKQNIKTDARKLFQDLDLYEKKIIDTLVKEQLTIYGMEKKGINRASTHRRIKGKLANKSSLINRGYVQLVRKEPYKGKVKNFYGLTFKGYCAAFVYEAKEALEKLAENWKEFDCSSKLEMIARLKLWLTYRTHAPFSKIYFTRNWEEDFKRYKYGPVVEIMNKLSLGTSKDSAYFVPIVWNFKRLFKSYGGLNEDEAEAVTKALHESGLLPLNRHLIESMEIELNKKYEKNIVEDISGYIQLGCMSLHLRFHVNQKIVSYLLEKAPIKSKKDRGIIEFLNSIELEVIGLSPSCPIKDRECPYGTRPIEKCARDRLKCNFIRDLLGKTIISRSLRTRISKGG